MTHHIAAFIARRPQLEQLARQMGDAQLHALAGGDFFLLPVTDDAFDAFHAAAGVSEPLNSEFWRLTKALAGAARASAPFGALAYVETDYFGGTGTQGAAAWVNGEVALEPCTSWGIGPINTALNIIGVAPASGMDEFDTLGLGNFRRMDVFE